MARAVVSGRTGKYTASLRSLAFPDLDIHLLNEIIQIALSAGQPASIKELRRRLRR